MRGVPLRGYSAKELNIDECRVAYVEVVQTVQKNQSCVVFQEILREESYIIYLYVYQQTVTSSIFTVKRYKMCIDGLDEGAIKLMDKLNFFDTIPVCRINYIFVIILWYAMTGHICFEVGNAHLKVNDVIIK